MIGFIKNLEKNMKEYKQGNQRRQNNFIFSKILLSSPWEKSFETNSTIYVKNKNESMNDLKNATVLKTSSYFGENIDVIHLLIDGKEINYTINDKDIEYFKLS